MERPALREDGRFSISHSVKKFIESMADPISSCSRPVTDSALASPIRGRRSVMLALVQRWQRARSECPKRIVPTTRSVLSRRQANLSHRDHLRGPAQRIARMLVAQSVLPLAIYVRSFVLLQSPNQTKMSQKSIVTPPHPQPQVPSIEAHGNGLKRWLQRSFVTTALKFVGHSFSEHREIRNRSGRTQR